MLSPSGKREASRFRRWLVQRVAETAWVWGVKGLTNLEMSHVLGIAPDVLVDARRWCDDLDRARSEVDGTLRVRTTGRNGVVPVDRTYQMRIRLPPPVYLAFQKLIELRGVREPTLVRSMIHHYLLQPSYPVPREYWTFEGKRLVIGRTANARWPWNVRCDIPYGVAVVLRRRAKADSVSLARVTRNLILDLVEGKLDHMRIITSPGQFFEPSRYHVGDQAVREVAERKFAKRTRRKR